jgi:hypothetical protein
VAGSSSVENFTFTISFRMILAILWMRWSSVGSLDFALSLKCSWLVVWVIFESA